MNAVYGEVSEIRELRSTQVCRISIEVPAESYKAVVAMLHDQRVLVTVAPPLERPYGVVTPEQAGEEPQPTEEAKPKEEVPTGLASLCVLAAIWCREEVFQGWLELAWPTLWDEARVAGADHEAAAKAVLCHVCGIESRKQLDTNAEAKRAFNDLIRAPYMAHLGTL